MVKRTGPTNVNLRKLITQLRKLSKEKNAKIWDYVADLLERPTRSRVEVNLGKIDKLSNDNDIVVVPGKVLSSGDIKKKVTIVAWRFSKSAIEKMSKAGINYYTIEEFIKENPDTTNVKIII